MSPYKGILALDSNRFKRFETFLDVLVSKLVNEKKTKNKEVTMKLYNKIVLSTAALAILLLSTSCTKEQGPTATDEDEIKTLINQEYTDWFEFTESYTGDSTDEGLTSFSFLAADSFQHVFAWWRRIDDVNRILDIHIENDTASVILTREIDGNLHLLLTNEPYPPETLFHILKPFFDTAIRYARFVRTGVSSEPRSRWTLDAISNIEITSENNTVAIDSILISYPTDGDSGNVDLMLRDPLELQTLDEVLTFAPNTPVTITVYTNDPENIAAFLHYNTSRVKHKRVRFQYDPDNHVFYGTWHTPGDEGVYHAGIDILNRATLLTDDYPYDSNAWLFIYRVVTPK